MTLKQRFLRAQEMLLCLCRKWWRPLTCLGLLASVWTNLVILPWRAGKPIEFAPAAAFVSAVVAAFAVREIGKIKGSSE
jgi:hypothetical protein